MIFNSFLYIFIFVPIVLIIYFIFSKLYLGRVSIVWLCIASLLFYGYWNPKYIILILSSIVFNYTASRLIQRTISYKQVFLFFSIVFNLGLLVYYKYFIFLIEVGKHIFSVHTTLNNIILPLGISFFTFTQIAFLVDCYKNKVQENSFINFMLFVTFFPHLLAGPIIHHSEMMPQFADTKNKTMNWSNIYGGLILFAIGLFKKVVIADYFVDQINTSYQLVHSQVINLWDAWSATLGYSVQIYFDFSGYTDMALGVALLFNIILPINFNSPYKALSIQDFWRRWHITLSRFLRDYLYIPLGGNRISPWRTELNIVIAFILGGIWHGAGYTYIIWGMLHALGYGISKIWSILEIKFNLLKLSKFSKLFITFMFINITWIFFRAPTLVYAKNMLYSMMNVATINKFDFRIYPIIVILVLCMLLPNSNYLHEKLEKTNGFITILCIATMLCISLFVMGVNTNTPFIYFQF